MDLMCLSAPFLGLKIVCGAVFIDKPAPRREMEATLVWTLFRTFVLIIALRYEFELLIYLIFLERVLIGVVSVVKARCYVGSNAPVTAPA